MKFFVVGCGSIGKRHIRNLSNLSAGEISVFDTNKTCLKDIEAKYNVETHDNLENGLKARPDVVLVCTPPTFHIEVALNAVKYDVDLFIEKPISDNLRNLDKFISEVGKRDISVLIGYNLRFHKGIQLLKKKIDEGIIGRILSASAEFGQYLPDWRPGIDYTKNYTAKKKEGGGIILDGTHEIDYITWLLGDAEKISCFADKLSNLKVDVEDTAEILLKFKNDSIARIHLDFTQRDYTRKCKIVGEKGTLFFDYSEGKVKIFTEKEKKWKIIDLNFDSNQMYVKEMEHLIRCVNKEEKPSADEITGKKVLEIALAAKKSSEKNKVIFL